MLSSNTISNSLIDHVLELPEVIQAKAQIDTMTQGHVSFSIPLTPFLREELSHIDLSATYSLPMRWVKGDTVSHIDQGANPFSNTYLAYLTDSVGEFLIEETAYPIAKGKMYVFSEGLRHQTSGTGNEPRLLLGPMSEKGLPVGFNAITADGATETIYIRYNPDALQNEYKVNNDDWNTFSLPIYIQNMNSDPSTHVLKVYFTTDIVLRNAFDYFGTYSSGIQFGSTSLNSDGTRPKIFVEDVTDYAGFIQNINHSYIYLFNLDVQSNGSTLDNNAGWVGQNSYGMNGSNNYIVHCSSNGTIPSSGGGIVGSNSCVGNGVSASSASLTLIGCSSSGAIGYNAGGIAGYRSGADGGVIVCEQCWSTGEVAGENAGGIFGAYGATGEGGLGGEALALKCYSTGAITGNEAGGIFGAFAGINSFTTANTCYSQGGISGLNAGGIYGSGATSNGGDALATNCYSSGPASVPANGIYSGGAVGGRVQTNCYVANNAWQNSDANTNLTGTPSIGSVGSTWVSVGDANDGYLFRGMGYSPYATQNIVVEEGSGTAQLVQSYSQSIYAGEDSSTALVENKAYTILQITSSQTPTDISIDSATGTVSTTTQTVPATYTMLLYNEGSYHITQFLLTILDPPIPTVPICFPAGTFVLTDQGEVAIQNINKKVHTINGQEIVAVTETISPDPYLICIEKHSLGPQVPNRRTLISKEHKVMCDHKMVSAEYLAEYIPTIHKVCYGREKLYNVLLREHSTMHVHNLKVETLHPENVLAKLYMGHYSPQQRRHYVHQIHSYYFRQERKKTSMQRILHR